MDMVMDVLGVKSTRSRQGRAEGIHLPHDQEGEACSTDLDGVHGSVILCLPIISWLYGCVLLSLHRTLYTHKHSQHIPSILGERQWCRIVLLFQSQMINNDFNYCCLRLSRVTILLLRKLIWITESGSITNLTTIRGSSQTLIPRILG